MRSLRISGKASRSRSNLSKANPYRDGSSGRFTTGGTGAVASSGNVTNVQIQTYPPDENGEISSRVTGEFKTKSGDTVKLIHDNTKLADGTIEMETVANLVVPGGAKKIGYMDSSRDPKSYAQYGATIESISVDAEYRRQGIASAMLGFARTYSQDGVKIDHSFSLTDDAKAWSSVFKANPYRDGSTGRFTTGGVGGVSTGTGVIGGPGKDITKQLEDVFFEKGTKRLVRNAETEKIRDDMKAQNQKNGSGQEDTALVIIAQKQGFDGKPKLVETQADLMEVQSKEGGLLVYRGIADYAQDGKEVSFTGARGADELRSGDYHAGFGVYGNGIYSTTKIDAASAYANMKDDAYDRRGNGVTVAMLIPQTAKAAPRDIVRATMKSVADRVGKDTSMNAHQGNDLGRALASQGFQYFDAGIVHGKASGVFVILDRSMLTVAKENL
jgi:hypothetical protein